MPKGMVAMKPERVTRQKLIRDRNWTRELVDRFAGEPDETRINMRYKSGGRVKYYDLERIQRIEKTASFRKAFEKSAPRKRAAAKAVETKRANTEEWLMNLPKPILPALTQEELVELAVCHYNGRQLDSNVDSHLAMTDSDPDFLDRISLNYLRHEMTNYEEELTQSSGRVGRDEAIHVIRTRILDAIGEAYPWLIAACCKKQKEYDSIYNNNMANKLTR